MTGPAEKLAAALLFREETKERRPGGPRASHLTSLLDKYEEESAALNLNNRRQMRSWINKRAPK